MLALLGAVAFAAVLPTRGEAAKQLNRHRDRIKITNSLGRKPILTGTHMMPGDRVTGRVKIGNGSRVRARFFLGFSKLVETPGQGGGRLSYRLVLTVKRLSARRRPQLMYTGPLRAMPMVKLGVFRPREKRIYQFSVLLPDGSPVLDTTYRQGSVSLNFRWYARRAR